MRLDWPRLRDQAIVVVGAIFLAQAVGHVLDYFLRILVVILLATLLAFALEPPLQKIDRFVPRWMAAMAVYAGAAGSIAILAAIFGQQLATQVHQLATQLPAYIDRTGTVVEHTAAAYGIPVSQSQPTSAIATNLTGAAQQVLTT